ncbi:MAG: glucose/galactose transporter [Ferruginibacter sp.]|nr:glucose/galactose transporter [Ferruginibacter sp.]
MKKQITVVNVGSLSRRDTIISLFILGLLFFIIGFVSWVNAILIPYFKIACELTNFQSYLVAFAFYISYLIMSVPSSYLLKSVGFKKGMMIAFWIMALGAFIFVPAALTRTYEIFLIGLFSFGTGLAILQTAVNPYITILGPKERAAQRISMLGIGNKAAGILAPWSTIGLVNSLVWAGIWPLALEGLGRFTNLGASILIMGLCGNAILPLLYGYLADIYNVRNAYWVLFPCYLYLLFYAIYGHRIKRWTFSKYNF